MIGEAMHIKGDYNSRVVTLDGKMLSPVASQKISNHSPDGFNWGYGGSGPSQLALGILNHKYGKDIALKYYQQFKWDFIVDWEYNFDVDIDIDEWLNIQKEKSND